MRSIRRPFEIPRGLDLADITHDIVRVYKQAIGPVAFSTEQGSNNWVVDGTMTVTGKPLLANDPHRPVQIPSLRKTVHLVAPGWNAIGAGEPALPGIALGHNENIGFGFTIVGIDQQDLYVEKLNPANPDEYRYRGAWKKVEIERQTHRGEGRAALRDRAALHHSRSRHLRRPGAHRAYALRWVGSEPGTAGYLAGLAVARASNWNEFLAAMERYKVPSENIVYADTEGNIGWQAAGMAPIRKNWSGVLPVPGRYGRIRMERIPPGGGSAARLQSAAHFIATANHNILPPGYSTFRWATNGRCRSASSASRKCSPAKKKFSIEDFERMQQDVTSLPARRLQAVTRQVDGRTGQPRGEGRRSRAADGTANLAIDSAAALIYRVLDGATARRRIRPGDWPRCRSGDAARDAREATRIRRPWRQLSSRRFGSKSNTSSARTCTLGSGENSTRSASATRWECQHSTVGRSPGRATPIP